MTSMIVHFFRDVAITRAENAKGETHDRENSEISGFAAVRPVVNW